MIGKNRWQLKQNVEENFNYPKKPDGNEHNIKEKYFLRKL